MAAMISAVDDGVGAILAELEQLGLAGETCTFFTSDNGPSRESRNWLDGNQDPYHGGSSGGLKGHKFSLFEGGVRVPGIVHFPGTVPGGAVIDHPFCSIDLLPTVCEWLDVDVSDLERQIDQLIDECQSLSDENQALRNQQANLMAERATLIEKSELARSRVEAMIARLKAMEIGA